MRRLGLSLAMTFCSLAGLCGGARAALVWSSPVKVLPGPIQLNAVACPSATECVAVDDAGHELTFNPTAPGTPAAVPIDHISGLVAIACASPTSCVAGDLTGDVVTFNPQAPGIPTPVGIDGSHNIVSLSCPASNECVALDDNSSELKFNPAAPGTPTAVSLGLGNATSLSCASPTLCAAVDLSGNETGFDPTNPGSPAAVPIDASNVLRSVSCPVTGECVAVDNSGHRITFNPTGGAHTTFAVDPGQDISSVSCTSGVLCHAVDFAGGVLSFSPAAFTVPTRHQALPNGTSGQIPCVGAGGSSVRCTFVDRAGRETTFDPASPGSPTAVKIDDGALLRGVACPAPGSCFVAGGKDGQVVTFDPAAPGASQTRVLDAGEPVNRLTCPGVARCVMIDSDHLVSFDPGSGATPTIENYALFGAFACPSASLCVTTDPIAGLLSTFNPVTPGTYTNTPFDTGHQIYNLGCADAGQCTAIDDGGGVLTFNPGSPGTPARTPLFTSYFAAFMCASRNQCTAVNYDTGQLRTFDPMAPATPITVPADSAANGLTALSCLTATDCVAIDAAGRALEGDPHGGSWSAHSVPGGEQLTALACTQSLCVAGDDVGRVTVGAGQPVAGSPPRVTGVAGQGQTLSVIHGGWTYAPTSFVLQWLRCDRHGNACTTIAHATAATYKQTAADVGHTIRVAETASVLFASGAPARSAPTKVIGGIETPAAIRALLRAALLPVGKAGRHAALRKAHGYRTSFTAPGAGKLVLAWLKGRVAVARVTISIGFPGALALKIRLTGSGPAVAKGLRLTGKGSFKPAGHRAVSVRAGFRLK